MKRARALFFGLPILASLALTGCGGGGGSSSTANPLAAGRTALNQVASGQKTASGEALQSIFDLFTQALQQDPNSSEANFGAAVGLTGVVAQQADGFGVGESGLTTVSASGSGVGSIGGGTIVGGGGSGGSGGNDGSELPPAPPNGASPPTAVPPRGALGLIWNLDRGVANPYTLLEMLTPITDIRYGFLPYYGFRSDNAAERLQMLERLNTVVQHLEKVEADPNFTVALPNVGADGQVATVTVGLPEVYLFDAYVNSLRMEIALSLAYVRESPGAAALAPQAIYPIDGVISSPPGGGMIGGAPVFSYANLDANKDGKLSPAEYLPPAPFLTLRDAGLLKTAQQALIAIADKAKKGIDGALARTAATGFLIANDAATRQTLTQTRDTVLPLIRQAANGPVTLETPQYDVLPLTGAPHYGGFDNAPTPVPTVPPVIPTYKVTINLAVWFASPPRDLRQFAPTLTLNANGWLQTDKTSYPDPTFGGLFPDGLPDSLRF